MHGDLYRQTILSYGAHRELIAPLRRFHSRCRDALFSAFRVRGALLNIAQKIDELADANQNDCDDEKGGSKRGVQSGTLICNHEEYEAADHGQSSQGIVRILHEPGNHGQCRAVF